MSGTPRLRYGAFPTTPQTLNTKSQYTSPAQKSSSKLPPVASLKKAAPPDPLNEPLIPLDKVDAATQRLIVAVFYAVLWFLRLYDFYKLVSGGSSESLWLFMKWVCTDAAVIFGLPALRIPWLEPSAPLLTLIFAVHVIFNGMLMFKIGLPVTLWLEALVKTLYDREVSISDRKVKPADLYNGDELISGKAVIHILPEGSAILNPHRESFCLGGPKHQIELPLQINQTNPILIELLRVDLDSADTEIITISSSMSKKLKNAAIKNQKPLDTNSPLLLRYPVKKPGRYSVQKIVDESKLHVRPRPSDVIVAQCPQARILQTSANKCRGELSDIAFEVIGAPPLKVKYRKMVNSNPVEASFQSIQPDDFISPFARGQQSLGTVANPGDLDASWARAQRVVVPVNETLFNSGSWWYSIDEVQDALGNVVSYAAQLEDYERLKGKIPDSQQIFTVHDRPRISLRSYGDRPQGCDPQHPLKVAKGENERLPIKFESEGKGQIEASHIVEYLFTPQDDLLSTGEHNLDAQKVLKYEFKNPHESLLIGESGLYSLKSVATQFCSGEVMEPASCLLQNPPEPELTITATNLTDRCAGNPVGLRLTLDFVGTPPFDVQYLVKRKGSSGQEWRTHKVPGHRGQLELTPPEAGHYTYLFSQISDKYYRAKQLSESIEQTVKPSASAHFESIAPPRPLCLYEKASFNIRLGGEGPWNLEYELVHGGQRKKTKVADITDEHYTIETNSLESGGEYTLSIASVEAGGCKEYLKEEVTFSVRHQRPKAGFSQIDGKRNIQTLEGKKLGLPLRLTGERPWTIEYRNKDNPSASTVSHTAYNENFLLEVQSHGTYELVGVRDASCPGIVDDDADQFTVSWIQRPTVKIQEGPTVEHSGSKYVKKDVCEGDEDFVELSFTGNPPFDVRYEEHAKPDQGQKSLRKKELNAALGAASIQLETSKAGLYDYKFSELADGNYDHDSKRYSPLILQQRVNPRPTARFTHPGKTYNFCALQGESSDEVIPVTINGVPPFHLEVEIRHSGSNKPETLNIPHIPSQAYSLRIPHKYLREGHSTLSIRKVRDSRNCQSKPEAPAAVPRVQISVHDAPTLTALETHDDYCVGEYLNFRLSGSPPFTIYYTFKGKQRKATQRDTSFRRIVDEPGIFAITAISDSASECRATVSTVQKTIHPRPRGAVSKGRLSVVDIHEGGETELHFDFKGTPPFEYTYIRSTEPKKGQKQQVLETKTETTMEFSTGKMVSAEGEYELISVKDAFCLSSKLRAGEAGGKKGQKAIMN